MRLTAAVLLIAAASAAAQDAAPSQGASQPQAAQTPRLMFLAPDVVVASVDGYKVTVGELQAILGSVSEQQRQAGLTDPRGLIEQIGLLRRISSEAEKSGLDQRSPVKEQLAYNRMLLLTNAMLQHMANYGEVTPEEVKKFYQDNIDVYTQARVKLIYIPFSPNVPEGGGAGDKKVFSESEAKARAEKIYAEIQKGADFVKMVREYSGDPTSASKDGDFMPIRKSDQLPKEIKDAVFSLKPGQISKPVRQPNGFYILRLESLDTEPFEAVQNKLAFDLRQAHVNEFIEKARNSIDIKIERPDAFSPVQPESLNK